MKFSPSLALDMAADVLVDYRKEIKREMYRRSFHKFFVDAWPHIDPAEFTDGKHLHMISEKMEMAARREIRNLVVCEPPRHCKSTQIAVAFPAWVWTWNPKAQFLFSSYADDLATRDSVRTRRLVESDWYQSLFGDTVQLRHDQNQKQYFELTAGGRRQICTPESKTTGLGGDYLICDDPHNVREAESEAVREGTLGWWFEAMPTRGNDPRTVVKIIVQQRVHERDLAGECMKRGYASLVLPARYEHDHPNLNPEDWRKIDGELLWPERFDEESLSFLMSEMGAYAVAGQFQQRPAPREGGLFQRSHFKIVKAIPAGCSFVRAWDLAATEAKLQKSDPDYTVGLKMARDKEGRFYIVDLSRMRVSPDKVEDAIKNTASQDGPSIRIRIPQDPGQAGKDQAQYYVRHVLPGYAVSSERETGDKVTRANPFSAQAEHGNVYLLEGAWNENFLQEASMFPNGAHDDQVDAATAAFRMFVGNNTFGMIEHFSKMYDEEMVKREKDKIERYARQFGWTERSGETAEDYLKVRDIDLP